ncbi:hypothetical protein SUGI_0005880 [Cryptomeria japonica]|nr:hypothetical protein SUGI_0005880 [Cryptomeria japonica]
MGLQFHGNRIVAIDQRFVNLISTETFQSSRYCASFQPAAMKAITNKDGEFVIELLRSTGRAIKKCFCLRRSVKLRRFRNGKGRFRRVWNACKGARTTFLTGNLSSFKQFFCLKGEIQEMKKDLKLLEAQMKDIDEKVSREGMKPSEDVRIWKEEAEKIKKAADELKANFTQQQNGEKMITQVVDEKFRTEKQNGYVGICPQIWHRLKMSLKVDEYKLRINQLQNRHTKFEGKYGGDPIEVLPRKERALKAFEMSEEIICSVNSWADFCYGVESFGDNSDLVHPLEKTPLFCLTFFLQFFTESETTVAGLLIICWIFVLTLSYVLLRKRKTRREPRISPMELERSLTEEELEWSFIRHSGDEIPQTAGSDCTACSEMMEEELGSSSGSQRKLDVNPQHEIVPIEDFSL